jgi:acyl carrier protein
MSAWASIEATIVDILSEVLEEPAARLRGHPVVAAYGWDSMASLTAFAQIESRLQVTLDLHRYHEARTIDDLVGFVMSAVAARVTATS